MGRFRSGKPFLLFSWVIILFTGCTAMEEPGTSEKAGREKSSSTALTPTRTTRPTWTPRPTATAPDTPTFTPSATPMPPGLAELLEITEKWKYKGFMTLGADRWARLSLDPRQGKETVAKEGEIVHGVEVGKVYSWKVELHYQGAVREIEVTPDAVEPTEVPVQKQQQPQQPQVQTRTDVPSGVGEQRREQAGHRRDERITGQETGFR